jgi:UDP-N-acetylmuramyl tripeptide synthase
MRILDSRRLTGPNLHLGGPAAIAEVAFEPGEDRDAAIATWRLAVTAALRALAWPVELYVRTHEDARGHAGADLVFAAPDEALYLATEINDWAIAAATERNAATPTAAEHGASDPRNLADPSALLSEWRDAIARERRPGLQALRDAAAARDLPALRDDDSLSIGHGHRSLTWPIGQLPRPADVPWSTLGRIPVALITGTNGKTTTARLLARIATHAGHVPGNTSTDGMSVGERLLEAGDWTGPAAARTVLRHPEVDLAVLEVARGGILRRGLAVDRCDAAVITNVSDDHLGDHGIQDLLTMARVKAVVASVVAPGGRVVLGADSPPLVELVASGHHFPAPLVWFAMSPDNPQLQQHRAAGGEAWFVCPAGALVRARGAAEQALVPVAELPFCHGGAAHHNVANALAAAALASALGLPDAAIVAGLRSFTSSVADNPGRANLARVGEVQVFLDFAHNPAGIRSLRTLLDQLRGPHRMIISMGVAGDRRDDDIREVARAVHDLAPDQVRVRDLADYLRGRAHGEVPALLRETLLGLGMAPDSVREVGSELDVLREGLAWARPGDVIAIIDHVERDEIQAELRALGAISDVPAR